MITIVIILIFVTNFILNAQPKSYKPPATERIPTEFKFHGFEYIDYYSWLETKDDPKVLQWSKEQHNFTLDFIKTNAPEIEKLRDEIKDYLDRDYRSAPFYVGNREFFWARKKGEQQNKLYTVINKKEKLIFDPMQIDPSGKSAVTQTAFTRKGDKVAIGLQFKGNEISDFRIIDTETGKQIGKTIEGLNSFNWTKDEKHAYITVRTAEMIKSQIPLRTYLHKIGSDRKNDIFLIAPKDAKDFVSIWDPRYGDVTFISEGDFFTNTLRIRKVGTMDEPKTIFSSTKFKANPQTTNDKIYFLTNYEAPNYKIMVTSIAQPEFENWKEFYPEKETVLEGFVITSNFVIVRYKKDVLSRLAAYDFEGKLVRELELPEFGNVSGMSYHDESNTVYVSLSTFTSPSKTYKLDGKTLKWEFFWQDEVFVDVSQIESKQVFYNSKDGTRVPMFIVYRKDIKLDGNNPTLLYGYGGFNITISPNFIGTTASFINRGGVYALACLRGGSEYGEAWHQDGMLHKKQNTFDDFIAAAEYLINESYTNPSKLCLRGGSNGGLLIGAMITQRPDLFKCAICAVPLLDMLRYHKFLIARYWIPEYGDPDKKEDFLYILKYSPYHNLRWSFNYPSILFKAGENDTRVDPMHAKKMAALMQNNPAQKNPILLFVDFESGHGSGQSINQMIDNIELEWRYIMWQLGMN